MSGRVIWRDERWREPLKRLGECCVALFTPAEAPLKRCDHEMGPQAPRVGTKRKTVETDLGPRVGRSPPPLKRCDNERSEKGRIVRPFEWPVNKNRNADRATLEGGNAKAGERRGGVIRWLAQELQ